MPDWLVPMLLTLGGGTGIGAILNAVFGAKSTANSQTNAFIDQLQEERTADREHRAKLDAKVERVIGELYDEKDYAAELLAWGLNGAPPPPPARKQRAIGA